MSMFERLGNQPQQQQQQSQDPRSAAMELMRKQGIDVPQGMENDPRALLQHVLQSGKVPQAQNRLSMAHQMMQRMFGGRR